MTTEQYNKMIEERLTHAYKMRDKYHRKYKETQDNEFDKDQFYTQYMMWWAVCKVLDSIKEEIDRSNTNNG